MIRFVGYFLGAISGIATVGSAVMLFYDLFVLAEDDRNSAYGQELALLTVIVIFSSLMFTYVYGTGFGGSKLTRVSEELEVLKIKQEISKLKHP